MKTFIKKIMLGLSTTLMSVGLLHAKEVLDKTNITANNKGEQLYSTIDNCTLSQNNALDNIYLINY